jgi:hypothetical protein
MGAVDYQVYLKSKEWRAKREWALERAGNRCQLCNSGANLHVHHRTYENLGHEHPGDVIVLCGGCHGAFHEKVAIDLSPEAVWDVIRTTRNIMATGSKERSRAGAEPGSVSHDEYLRRAERAFAAFPLSLRAVVAGALLEWSYLERRAVLALYRGSHAGDVAVAQAHLVTKRLAEAGRRTALGFPLTPSHGGVAS